MSELIKPEPGDHIISTGSGRILKNTKGKLSRLEVQGPTGPEGPPGVPGEKGEKGEEGGKGLEILPRFETNFTNLTDWIPGVTDEERERLENIGSLAETFTVTPEGLQHKANREFGERTRSRQALLKYKGYYEEENIDKPILGPYYAIAHITFGEAKPWLVGRESIRYGIRVCDFANWQTGEYVNGPRFAEDAGVGTPWQAWTLHKPENRLELVSFGLGHNANDSKVWESSQLDYWMTMICLPTGPASVGPYYQCSVWLQDPTVWANQPVGSSERGLPAPLLTKDLIFGFDEHHTQPMHGVRVGLEVYEGRQSLAEEGGFFRSLRVEPLLGIKGRIAGGQTVKGG